MAERAINDGTSYDADFYRWTQETAELVCRGEFRNVDREHLAEEIADLGKRDGREMRWRMTVLVVHLLKWQAQPQSGETSSWRQTIIEQQDQLELLFEDSQSLYRATEDELPSLCRRAAKTCSEGDGAGSGGVSEQVSIHGGADRGWEVLRNIIRLN